MSIGFLLKDRGDSVVWRGPKKDGMIRQFLSEVRWGELDYLVIDTPPGELGYHPEGDHASTLRPPSQN
jgi:Mrp family chromosome partitioning ATPase